MLQKKAMLKEKIDIPSSALSSHSTNFLVCSRNTLLPFAPWDSLYHLRMTSSDNTSAVIKIKNQLNLSHRKRWRNHVSENGLLLANILWHQWFESKNTMSKINYTIFINMAKCPPWVSWGWFEWCCTLLLVFLLFID